MNIASEKMEVSFTYQDEARTIIVNNDSTLATLSKYATEVEDEYIITLIDILKGDELINNLPLFLQKVDYYNVGVMLEERFDELYKCAIEYLEMPDIEEGEIMLYGKYSNIFVDNLKYAVDRDVLFRQIISNNYPRTIAKRGDYIWWDEKNILSCLDSCILDHCKENYLVVSTSPINNYSIKIGKYYISYDGKKKRYYTPKFCGDFEDCRRLLDEIKFDTMLHQIFKGSDILAFNNILVCGAFIVINVYKNRYDNTVPLGQQLALEYMIEDKPILDLVVNLKR
jgi:hypothetical protein